MKKSINKYFIILSFSLLYKENQLELNVESTSFNNDYNQSND